MEAIAMTEEKKAAPRKRAPRKRGPRKRTPKKAVERMEAVFSEATEPMPPPKTIEDAPAPTPKPAPVESLAAHQHRLARTGRLDLVRWIRKQLQDAPDAVRYPGQIAAQELPMYLMDHGDPIVKHRMMLAVIAASMEAFQQNRWNYADSLSLLRNVLEKRYIHVILAYIETALEGKTTMGLRNDGDGLPLHIDLLAYFVSTPYAGRPSAPWWLNQIRICKEHGCGEAAAVEIRKAFGRFYAGRKAEQFNEMLRRELEK